MSRLVILILTIITISCVSVDAKENDTTIEEVLSQARKEKKHVFIRFTEEGCLPCQVLEDQLSFHPKIVSQIKRLYLNVELDVDDPSNKEWIETYDIKGLPTIIIIDETGAEVDRMDGYTSMDSLRTFLNTNKKSTNQSVSALLTNLSLNENPKKEVEENFVSLPQRNERFVIQFGAFSSYANAKKLSAHLLHSEKINTVIVQESSKGKPLYMVRQTTFEQGKSEDFYINTYKRKGIDCMLKKS